MDILKYFFDNQDKAYGDFSFKSIPGVKREAIIGVRIPKIRAICKEIPAKDKENFLNTLPHKYHEENLLQGFLLQQIKDYDEAINRMEKFLPYVDNWMVSDTMTPKVFRKHRNEVFPHIQKWIKSKETYTIRFGVVCMMALFLDKEFEPSDIQLISSIKSNEYYVNMVVAWYLATALAKQWDATIKTIESQKLEKWVHNKTIQKAIESYRVSDEHKAYLKSLKK